MGAYYVLDDNRWPRPIKDVMEWARWFETADRHVGNNVVKVGGKQIRVSTVFLGIDHNWGHGPPLLFETMIFGGWHADYQTRCSTWDEAVEQHQVALDLVTEEAMTEG